jgi:hypothetical protein
MHDVFQYFNNKASILSVSTQEEEVEVVRTIFWINTLIEFLSLFYFYFISLLYKNENRLINHQSVCLSLSLSVCVRVCLCVRVSPVTNFWTAW